MTQSLDSNPWVHVDDRQADGQSMWLVKLAVMDSSSRESVADTVLARDTVHDLKWTLHADQMDMFQMQALLLVYHLNCVSKYTFMEEKKKDFILDICMIVANRINKIQIFKQKL